MIESYQLHLACNKEHGHIKIFAGTVFLAWVLFFCLARFQVFHRYPSKENNFQEKIAKKGNFYFIEILPFLAIFASNNKNIAVFGNK